jgi:hypothetical protein
MVDREELAQVRALAEVEGTCPVEAVRAFLRQEHRYYDIIGGYGRPTHVPLPLPGPARTAESVERRKAYTREWWRANGAAYRARRKLMNGSAGLAADIPADSLASFAPGEPARSLPLES